MPVRKVERHRIIAYGLDAIGPYLASDFMEDHRPCTMSLAPSARAETPHIAVTELGRVSVAPGQPRSEAIAGSSNLSQMQVVTHGRWILFFGEPMREPAVLIE